MPGLLRKDLDLEGQEVNHRLELHKLEFGQFGLKVPLQVSLAEQLDLLDLIPYHIKVNILGQVLLLVPKKGEFELL